MRHPSWIGWAGLLLSLQGTLLAQSLQSKLSPTTRSKIASVAEELRKDHPLKVNEDYNPFFGSLLDRSQILREFAYLHPKSLSQVVNQADQRFQARRIDRQFGESSAGGASTSLVSKTGVADLIIESRGI